VGGAFGLALLHLVHQTYFCEYWIAIAGVGIRLALPRWVQGSYSWEHLIHTDLLRV
jgi:hypothetical protein